MPVRRELRLNSENRGCSISDINTVMLDDQVEPAMNH